MRISFRDDDYRGGSYDGSPQSINEFDARIGGGPRHHIDLSDPYWQRRRGYYETPPRNTTNAILWGIVIVLATTLFFVVKSS